LEHEPLVETLYLDDAEIETSKFLAQKSFAKWQDVQGHYRNSINSHLVGRYGEVGAERYFLNNGLPVQPNFYNFDNDALCDIDTPLGRCEVKTWTFDFWQDWGRAISYSQLPYLKEKADFILWCGVKEKAEMVRVHIFGWNLVSEIESVAPRLMGPSANQVNNYQLGLESVRSLDDLWSL